MTSAGTLGDGRTLALLILHAYLRAGRQALLRKIEGLSPFDADRPESGRPGENLPDVDPGWWLSYRNGLEEVVRSASD